MEKINIGELLKDCPKGMELDCTICDNVYLDEVTPTMIKCFIKNDVYNTIYFHHDGTYLTTQNAKCVIFPKGKTTWEGFQIPFKDGDILATDLGSVFYLNTLFNTDERYGCYVGIGGDGSFHICAPFAYKECCGFATEEEKQKLFDAIKANGYKWNAETKTLEKLKVSKFDFSTLKPFESRVLVRSCNDDIWKPAIWGIYNDIYNSNYPYITTYGATCQCIPFEGNEYLLGTTNDCDDYYKTWE